MNRKILAGIIAIEGLAFMLLEGSIITLGLIVAPRVFRTIESPDLAGRVFGNILGVWVWLGMACTFVLLASAIWTAWQTHFNRLMLVRTAVLLVMGGLVIWFGTVVSQITTIQASLTKPIEQYAKDVNPRLEFDALHKLSTNLLSTDLFLALFWFGLSVVAFARLQPTTSTVKTAEKLVNRANLTIRESLD